METLLKYFVAAKTGYGPVPQPRPRGRIMKRNGKPAVHIYDQLQSFEERLPGQRHRVRKPWDAAMWRDRVIAGTRRAWGDGGLSTPLTGPVHVNLDFWFPRPGYMLGSKYPTCAIPQTHRPDRDNLEKLILDAITQAGWREGAGGKMVETALVWEDDCQVCAGEVRKFFVERGRPGGVSIEITPLQDQAQRLFSEPSEITTTTGNFPPYTSTISVPKSELKPPKELAHPRELLPAGRPKAGGAA